MVIKAQIATVQVGSSSIEGLMAEGGQFGIAIPQMVSLELVPPNRSTKQLESLIGIEFASHVEKWKSPLNSKEVNVIPLEHWSRLIIELAFSGNLKAMNLVRDLNDLSWHQLFCDAFHIKFETEDRQKFLREREIHRVSYHPLLTSWLKQDGCSESWEYGKKVNEFKSASDLPIVPITQYTPDELSLLNRVEGMYDIMRRAGHDHHKAIQLLNR